MEQELSSQQELSLQMQRFFFVYNRKK